MSAPAGEAQARLANGGLQALMTDCTAANQAAMTSGKTPAVGAKVLGYMHVLVALWSLWLVHISNSAISNQLHFLKLKAGTDTDS